MKLNLTLIPWSLFLASELTSALAGPLDPPILDPKGYKSPSGQYKLLVDPSDCYGAGSAKYGFFDGEHEIWSGERPFTLWDARVSDDGIVGGYAYSHGLGAWKENGNFRVIAIERCGAVRLDQVMARRNAFPEVPPSPYARGILLDPRNDRMVVRIADSDPNRCIESWWAYSISRGSRDRVYHPHDMSQSASTNDAGQGKSTVLEAEPVQGTTLSLVNWTHYDREFEETEANFSLIDLAGRNQWTCRMPKGTRIFSSPIGQRRFALITPSTGERIDYVIEQSDSRSFSVRELRRDVSTATRVSLPPRGIEARPLRLVGQIELRSPDDTTGAAQERDANPNPERWSTYSSVEFDNTGRIYAIGRHDMAVRVFSPQGTLLRTLSPNAVDTASYHRSPKISVSKEGDVYVDNGSGELGRLTKLIHYSPTGAYLGVEPVSVDEPIYGWHCHSQVGQHWVVGYHRIFLVNPGGRIAKTIARCPDDRWLARPYRVSVASDGSLAVVARRAVSFYSAQGAPVAMTALPPSTDQLHVQVAYNGKHAVIIDRGVVFLIDASGTTLRLLRPSANAAHFVAAVPFLTLTGGDLVVFDGERTIKRYKLPVESAGNGR